MTERAAGPEDLLAGLHDIRPPLEAAGGWPAEAAVILAAALIAAWAVSFALPLVTAPPRTREETLADRIAAARALPEGARVIALLHLIRAERPEALPDIAPLLYRPDAAPDAATLEALLTAPPAPAVGTGGETARDAA